MVKLKWPHKKHWRTRQLINKYPVLKSNKANDSSHQSAILCCELILIKRIEEVKELEPSYKKYKMEITQAIDQIKFTPQQILELKRRILRH